MKSRRSRRNLDKPPTLNLVSLMDIFTILVFFLMVNANEVEILETTTSIKLPDSISEEKPEERVSIEVSNDELLLQGKVIGSISTILTSESGSIDVLVRELASIEPDNGIAGDPRKVTIMGDKTLPYELLKRVMLSCQEANYRLIALAVNQVSESSADQSGESAS